MKETRKFDLDDIVIIPAIVSDIESRKECEIDYDGMLPLIASPMDTVVDEYNFKEYLDNGITPCLPRGKYLPVNSVHLQKVFISYGIQELIEELDDYDNLHQPVKLIEYDKILIDIANGHMKKLVDVVKRFKTIFPDKEIMVGNVANPLTFKNLAMAGADYIRLSIGTGAGCTTAANVAINYPLGSLITECFDEKIKGGFWNCNIIADGGMRNYSDIIKALGLGADYVMLGSMFNKAIESAGFNYFKKIKINNKLAKILWNKGYTVTKKYRGMSTKSVQKSWGKTNLTTAEGITKYQPVEYTLKQWTDNFKDYLRSNMSYSGIAKLYQFVGKAEWRMITENSRKRFQK